MDFERTREDEAATTTSSSLDVEGRHALTTVLARLTGRHTQTRIGRYVLHERLGAGACGAVFSGHDPKLDRCVAIKVVRATGHAADDRSHERLVREAQSLAKLHHPNVVQVFDVGIDETTPGGRIFIVMELIDGVTLEGWVAERRPTVAQIVAAYVDAARGLAAAHAVGVVHRDFKPANAMMTDAGEVKVLDFGLARDDQPDTWRGDSTPMHDVEPSSLTRTGIVMGTPRYMSPEQHFAEPVTDRSDQYSLAVSLWEALAGAPPFPGATMRELGDAKAAGAPARPRMISRKLYATLARALDPDPARRFDSMTELVTALESHDRRRRRSGLAGLATVGVFVAGAAMTSPELSLCADPPATWSDRFAGVVARTTPPRTDPRWGLQERVELRLARFQSQWSAARQEVCSAEPGPRRQAQAECLDRAAERFETRLRAIELGPELSPSVDVRRLLGLEVPARCTSDDPSSPFVVDPEVEARLQSYRELADVVVDADTPPAHAAALDAAIEDARRSTDAYVVVRLLLARGQMAMASGDARGAADFAMQATWHAQAAGDPLLGAESITGAIAHLMDANVPRDEIERMMDHAAELIEAAGTPPVPTLELAVLQTLHAVQTGRMELAAERSDRALAMARDEPPAGTESLLALTMLTSVGLRDGELGPADAIEQLQQVVDMGRGVADPGIHATLAVAHDLMSAYALELGDTDRAIVERIRQLDDLSVVMAPENPAVMFATSAYGRVLVHRGATTEGFALMRHAYDTIVADRGAVHGRLSYISGDICDAYVQIGQPEAALPWLDRHLEHATAHYGEGHRETLAADLWRAKVLVALGRLDEAEPAITAAFGLDDLDATEYWMHAHDVRGDLRLAQGRFEAAQRDFGEALARLGPHRQGPADAGFRGELYADMAAAARGLGQTQDAATFDALAAEAFARGDRWDRQRLTGG